MSKKGVTNILKSVGFVAGATVTVTGLGLCGYALADGAVKLPSTATEIITPTPPQDVSTVVTDETITIVSIANAEYSLDGIVWQNSNIFLDLQPAQEYTVYIRIKATADTPASEPTQVNVTTDKSTQQVPQVTTPKSTADSIIFEQLAGVEYSIDNGDTWQDENIFSNLLPATEYIILVRYAETDTHYASESVSVQVSTLKNSQGSPQVTQAQEVTIDTITMPVIAGAEYSLNCEVWQDSNVFSGLELGQTYTIYIRYKETDTHYASDIAQIEITTSKYTNNETPNVQQNNIIVESDYIRFPANNTMEFGMLVDDEIIWQENSRFLNLTPNTEYTVYVRYKETDTHYASDYVEFVVNTTIQPIDIMVEEVTKNSITVSAFSPSSELIELAIIEGEYPEYEMLEEPQKLELEWQEYYEFTGLNEGTCYTVFARYVDDDSTVFAYTPIYTSIEFSADSGLYVDDEQVYTFQELVDNDMIKVEGTRISSCSDEMQGELVISEGITEIETSTFYGCDKLTSIVIPDTVTYIGGHAFRGCTSLVNITLPNNPEYHNISAFSFQDCTSLRTITIPDNVKTIMTEMFTNCTNLTIILESTTPPTIYASTLSSGVTSIMVPMASVDAYKTATYWSDYADKIVGYE